VFLRTTRVLEGNHDFDFLYTLSLFGLQHILKDELDYALLMKRRLEYHPDDLKAFEAKYSCFNIDSDGESSNEEIEIAKTTFVEGEDSDGTLTEESKKDTSNIT
jgi:hypothetical protein